MFPFQEVTSLDFHPFHQILVSGSKDFSVKFFEFSKPSVKKAYKSIQVRFVVNYGDVNCGDDGSGGDGLLLMMMVVMMMIETVVSVINGGSSISSSSS